MAPKKILRILLPLVIVVAVGIWAFLYFQQETPPTDHLRLFGNVDNREIRLAFHDPGRIQEIFVQEGSAVQVGALVAQLDPKRYESAVAEARARVTAQQEALSLLLSGSRDEEISEAQARVHGAEATLKDATQAFSRAQALAANEYVPRQKVDAAEAALQNARANLDAAQQRLTLAIKGPRDEEIAAARAKLEQSRAALQLAEQQLADTSLRAPANGIVQNRILEPGDMAFPQTPVLTLALTDPVWVRAYVSEPDLGKITPGMQVDVQTDSFPDKTYPGWIGYISPTAEFTPKRIETTELRSKLVYQVRAYVCNPENELHLGMPATVDVLLDAPLKKALDTASPCQDE